MRFKQISFLNVVKEINIKIPYNSLINIHFITLVSLSVRSNVPIFKIYFLFNFIKINIYIYIYIYIYIKERR